jgi:HJR/Mrr/RecB family endonuclease
MANTSRIDKFIEGAFWVLVICPICPVVVIWLFIYLRAEFFVALGAIVLAILSWGTIKTAIGRRKRCVHGVRSGKDGGCKECGLEEERCQLEEQRQLAARLAALKAEQALQRLKKEIKEKARLLQDSELKMLRKRWLSRAELYFEMAPEQFENAVAELFRQLGYQVTQTPYSNDRGKDAIARKDGKKYLIECKRYAPENTIGRRDLQILVAAMKEENAEGGFYVNTGRFASTAPAYAAQNQIELYDRANLPALVNSAFPVREDISSASAMCLECGAVTSLPVGDAPSLGNCANGHQVTNSITTELICRSSSVSVNGCPKCGSQMRLKHGWRGTFWGCSKYPACRGTREFETSSVTREQRRKHWYDEN